MMADEITGQTKSQDLYLDLMKQCLTRYLFIDQELRDVEGWSGWRKTAYSPVKALLGRFGLSLVRPAPADRAGRQRGEGWPGHAETMVGLKRLDNVHHCVADVIENDVPGDLIEAGVWRGGTTIFMRAALAAYDDRTRRVWVADSFRGFPVPDPRHYPAGAEIDVEFPWLQVGLDEVKANFARYDLLDDRVRFLEGWFKDTLPTAPIDRLAVIRLDGDLYESTWDAISALYPKLSLGGYLIVDDYGCIEECRRAIHDYRSQHGITEPIETIDWTGVYWKRTESQV